MVKCMRQPDRHNLIITYNIWTTPLFMKKLFKLNSKTHLTTKVLNETKGHQQLLWIISWRTSWHNCDKIWALVIQFNLDTCCYYIPHMCQIKSLLYRILMHHHEVAGTVYIGLHIGVPVYSCEQQYDVKKASYTTYLEYNCIFVHHLGCIASSSLQHYGTWSRRCKTSQVAPWDK